jgi:2-polyprenyl-6-hydroxyphenyl methylase/3-demethylubiquinone-9 3-methyltransferase
MRFEFGKNWEDYAKNIEAEEIEAATACLNNMMGGLPLAGKTFLDIGSGSGIHSLAALRSGVSSLFAVDLDRDSVATTKAVLAKHWEKPNYQVAEQSVFDLDPESGQFDIVYSWGVLHHTGNMAEAIRKAAAMVAPNGHFAVALYGKTRYCGVWWRIKRWYVSSTPEQQKAARNWYTRLFSFYLLLRGQTLAKKLANFNKKRGMSFEHDVHDWMGGFPYESITAKELYTITEACGLTLIKAKTHRRSGLFGSGCDEFLFGKR